MYPVILLALVRVHTSLIIFSLLGLAHCEIATNVF